MPRILAALVFAPAFLAVLWLGGLPLLLTCALLALLMQFEVASMALGGQKLAVASLPLGLGLAFATMLGLPAPWSEVAQSTYVVGFLLLTLAMPGGFLQRLQRVSVAAVLTLYAGGLIGLLFVLRERPQDGLMLATLAAFTPWAADTGAYFAGRHFGRHKMAPSISPAKTWEGAVGGALWAAGFAFLWGWVLATPVPAVHWYACAMLAAAFGLLGDLVESLLKRSFGAKDSSRLIPGHGGVLDRFDSVLFAAFAVYVYCSLLWPVP